MPLGSRLKTSDASQPSGELSASKEKNMVDASSRFLSVDPRYRMENLVLTKRTSSEMDLLLSYLKNHQTVFVDWGFMETHGNNIKNVFNFYGPPGTGKTMAAHAVAAYLNKKIIVVNYAEIESKYVGETPKNIVALFNEASQGGHVLFFDEADAMFSKRVTNMTSSTDTRSVLLNIINDFGGILVLATNFIENFDPAFMRRIKMHVYFTLPDAETRYRLFKLYLPGSAPYTGDIDQLIEPSDELSGSDIANATLQAAFDAAKMERSIINNDDIINAIYRIKSSKVANVG